jgi:hypothetical protein
VKPTTPPLALGAANCSAWRPLTTDDPPPEGHRFWVRLKNGCEHYATREGRYIRVGIPDAIISPAIFWKPDDDQPNAEVSHAADK